MLFSRIKPHLTAASHRSLGLDLLFLMEVGEGVIVVDHVEGEPEGEEEIGGVRTHKPRQIRGRDGVERTPHELSDDEDDGGGDVSAVRDGRTAKP